MVPSGHERKTHGPAGALRAREGRERKSERNALGAGGEGRRRPRLRKGATGDARTEEKVADGEGPRGAGAEGGGEEDPEVKEALSR